MPDTLTRYDTLRQELITFDALKVWSVVVTILGDLAPGAQDEIPGPYLSALTAQMGIKPQALRVAIHRLKNDGWLASRKAGRVRHYHLTPFGREETQRVQARVYGAGPTQAADWHVVLTDQATAARQGIALRDGMTLVSHALTPAKGEVVARLTQETAPEWVLDAVCPPEVKAQYERLAHILSRFDVSDLPAAPLDRVTLRLLVLHAWRRLALRSDLSAIATLFPDWPGARTGALVQDILAHLPRPDRDAISG